MKLYAFRDISISSPDPIHLPCTVNLELGLNELQSTTYNSDFDFHNAMSMLLNDFKDAHTRYSMPVCYSSFVFRLQPAISFSSIAVGGVQKIVANDVTGKYQGYEVSAINGESAVEALHKWARTYGRDSLDEGTRFNQILKVFTSRPVATYGIPTLEHMEISFTKIQNPVTFSWKAFSSANMTGTSGLASLCQPQTTEIRNGSIPFIDWLNDENMDLSHQARADLHKSAMARHIAEMHAQYESKQFESSSDQSTQNEAGNASNKKDDLHVSATPIPASGTIVYQSTNTIFSVVKPGVGALRMPSFFPSEFGLDTTYSIKSIPQFLFDVQRVYVLAHELKIKELIIDLRGNGGGWICLSMELLRILFPGPSGTPPAGELFDMIDSPLLGQIATRAAQLPKDVYSIFSPWKYYRPEDFQPYQTTSWLYPGRHYTRGGVNSRYSNMVTDDCTMVDIPGWNPEFLFSPSNVLILTDGTCGSACALFARNIQERAQAKTMVVGGIMNRPQMVASFIGGLVYDLPTLLEELKLLKLLESPIAPKPFLTSANLRFTLWEQYPWANRSNPPIPAEFVFEASDYRLMYTLKSVSDNQALYEDAHQTWRSGGSL